jgi:hypothetical protein
MGISSGAAGRLFCANEDGYFSYTFRTVEHIIKLLAVGFHYDIKTALAHD